MEGRSRIGIEVAWRVDMGARVVAHGQKQRLGAPARVACGLDRGRTRSPPRRAGGKDVPACGDKARRARWLFSRRLLFRNGRVSVSPSGSLSFAASGAGSDCAALEGNGPFRTVDSRPGIVTGWQSFPTDAQEGFACHHFASRDSWR